MKRLSAAPKNRLIGHRGTGGLRPENTLCSFSNAAAIGLNWIEFDVQLTRDDQWVVMHDDTIDRTTNGHGKINQYTLQELEQFEAGLWYKPQYPNQAIPTLADTLILADKLGLQVNIEVKGAETDPDKHAALMTKFLRQHMPASIKPLLSSFDLNCIQALRLELPEIDIAYLVDNFAVDTVDIALANNFISINCDVQTITPQDIRLATNNDIAVLLYTINDPSSARKWFEQGIYAIFTDRADLLLPT